VFLGTYNLKKSTYQTFEKILKINFDTIIRTTQKIELKGMPAYAIYIYHIQVDYKDFLDPVTELTDGSNGSKSSKGKWIGGRV
jgi:hypothetical protein